MEGDQPYVFVSYSRADQAYVDRLVAHLAERGVNPWIDRHTDYGERWLTVIRQRVDGCAAMIVVQTPAAERSPWVEREILRAEDTGKPILPLLLDGPRFFSLGNRQHEDVRGGLMPSDRFVAQLPMSSPIETPPDLTQSGLAPATPADLDSHQLSPEELSRAAQAFLERSQLNPEELSRAGQAFLERRQLNPEELSRAAQAFLERSQLNPEELSRAAQAFLERSQLNPEELSRAAQAFLQRPRRQDSPPARRSPADVVHDGKTVLTILSNPRLLTQRSLAGANLVNVDLRGFDLTGVDLTRANLDGTDFTDSTLTGAHLTHAKYSPRTIWPAGFAPPLLLMDAID